jgi:hypothetical protein
METKLQKNRKIIDIFTMTEYDISSNMMLKCKELGIDYTTISKLEKGLSMSIKSRYTTPNHIDKIFTLIDVDTNIEYNCIDNNGIFLQMNYPYSENEGKYVYELKSGRQAHASICGKVFKMKNSKIRRIIKMKNDSNHINDLYNDAYKRKIIKYRVSKRIWEALKSVNIKKDKKAEEFLGCSAKYLVKYLKSRFTDKMTLENYGDWHIDHIKPCSHFDLKDESQLKLAFHYTNLQPIWGSTKIAKKYGFENYVGNLNKTDSDIYQDYYLTNILSKYESIEKAIKMSDMLVRLNVKKI